MSSEYEWDRAGDPDADVQELERLLGALRYEEPLRARVEGRSSRVRWQLIAAAAAAVVVLGVGISLWPRNTAPVVRGGSEAVKPCTPTDSTNAPWSVSPISGSPRCGASKLERTASLPIGGLVETDASSRAEIVVADIGRIVLEANSRLTLKTSKETEHRLQLDYGELHARVDAPPRLFLVQTPSATAVDIGCEYTLNVSDSGVTRLHVLDGYVSLERGDRNTYVPAGYVNDSFPGIGPSIPYAADAPESLKRAIHELARSPDSSDAVVAVLRASTIAKDTLGLWHLLSWGVGSCEATVSRIRELTGVDPDPLGQGWGWCDDPHKISYWQSMLESNWEP